MSPEALEFAERVRDLLLRTALEAYEDAAVRGLCAEGAWEVAVAAMRRLEPLDPSSLPCFPASPSSCREPAAGSDFSMEVPMTVPTAEENEP